ncbi:DUF1196 domain-containing protein [Vibrio cholerae]|nr:DUF1196 domain-containing protein [Vibrio cholerae]
MCVSDANPHRNGMVEGIYAKRHPIKHYHMYKIFYI